jgi:tripartite-type tricarboxylate transporter receptor subunit TctC
MSGPPSTRWARAPAGGPGKAGPLADPAVKARLADLGATPFPHTPAAFGAYVAAETEKWGKVVRAAGLKAQ